MNKAILIILSLTVCSVFGQTCVGNPLTTAFGISPLANPTSGSTHTYCKTLKEGTSCCTDEVVNGFQAKANELIANLTATLQEIKLSSILESLLLDLSPLLSD